MTAEEVEASLPARPGTSSSSCKSIETQSGKTLSIETQPTPVNLAKCDPQHQSLFFNKLPAELRDEIFSLVLLGEGYGDTGKPTANDYQAGNVPRRPNCTNLLLACRRVWLEANHWPMLQTIHSFWSDDSERPEWVGQTELGEFTEQERVQLLFNRLTPVQAHRLRHVQLLGDPHDGPSDLLQEMLSAHAPNIATFTFTIENRNCTSKTLLSEFRMDWFRDLLRSVDAHHISEVRLELETPHISSSKEKTLESMSDLAENIKAEIEQTSRSRGWELIEPLVKRNWSGPGRNHGASCRCGKADYFVHIMRWKSLRHRASELVGTACQSSEGKLSDLTDKDAESSSVTASVDGEASGGDTEQKDPSNEGAKGAEVTDPRGETYARVAYQCRWNREGSLLKLIDNVRPSESDESIATAPEPEPREPLTPFTRYDPVNDRLIRILPRRRPNESRLSLEQRQKIAMPPNPKVRSVPNEDVARVGLLLPAPKRRQEGSSVVKLDPESEEVNLSNNRLALDAEDAIVRLCELSVLDRESSEHGHGNGTSEERRHQLARDVEVATSNLSNLRCDEEQAWPQSVVCHPTGEKATFHFGVSSKDFAGPGRKV